MMRIMILTAMLVLGGVALLPEAAAECEPNYVLYPNSCSNRVQELLGGPGCIFGDYPC